ncbi:MAG: MarR family transcriptional regulator [Pseudomonadota bacterium]|jgi:MarR family transcriptional regulator, transcriptional regulator for hemolysin|nr:MarR family transcriptional regulator [Pseudomonadota bacterium]
MATSSSKTPPAATQKVKASKKTKPKGRFRAGFLVHDVSRLRRTVFDQRLKHLHVTRSQWWVLTNLSRHDGEGFSQIELARLLEVGKVTLGGLIDRLEKNGLVERVPDKEDRRSKRVVMSQKGADLLHKLEAIATVVNAESMIGVSPEEEEQLVSILARIKHNLIQMDAVSASISGGKPKQQST